MSRVATDQCTRNLEEGHSVRKKKEKVKNRLKGSGKVTMVSSYRILEKDAMKSDNEVSEEKNKNVTMHKAEKMTDADKMKRERKKMKIEKDNIVVTQSKEKKLQVSDADKIKLVVCNREVKDDGDEKAMMDDIEEAEKERKAEKKRRKKEKREQRMLLNGEEMEKERKAEKKRRKKDKRDCMVLSVDKETKAKKRKIEKDNVVVTQSKEKKRKLKDMKGDVVKDNGDEKALMDDIEEMKKERKAEKKKRKKEKREQKMLLNSEEMEKERKAEKKRRKKDRMVLSVDKETKAKKKKRKIDVAGHEEHNKLKGENENKEEVKKRKIKKNKVLVVHENEKESKTRVEKKKSTKKKEKDEVSGIEEKRVERKTKKIRDDMKTHDSEKKRERKDIEFEEDVEADLEEQSKVQHENMKSFSPSDSLKSLIDNAGGLIQGKRFSEEENELVKKAVWEYIKVMKLGKEGLDMVLESKCHSLLRGCWQKIGRALPWRPYLSVYQRARRLFTGGDSKWTAEEVQHLRKSYEKYGPKWKKVADELGKYHGHVRNAFHRYRSGNLNKGKWSQHEYQTLFEQVNKDLQINVFVEKKYRHGMLRDNIKWETISCKMGTRNPTTCCTKWYRQLTSPMVAEGIWTDADDYKLVKVLDELDASCEEEVEWDNLLEYSSGEMCRKRWLQMVRHLGEHGNKTFSEQVEVLSKRYCPDMAELREALDARPIVD